jgi:hypothetical protein
VTPRGKVVQWVAVGLLCAAAVLSIVAWQVQSSALDDIKRARRVQGSEVPESDAPPPDLEQYAQILDTLDESIEIRKQIDGRLAKLEALVRSFDARRKDSEEIAVAGRGELLAIGRILGGAAGAADRSVTRLRDLGGQIGTSARLTRLIAEELEELDRSFGPTLELPDLLENRP